MTVQMLVLGLLFVAVAAVSDGAYAVTAGTAAEWLRASGGYLRAQRWVSGIVFIGLGAATALTGSKRSA